MSQYYNPKRTRNLYEPESRQSFRLSRSKIDLFIECSKCFYLDRRLGVGRPPGYPFTLNSAVDALLKKEFDKYRQLQAPHPLMQQNGINAIPFKHPKMEEWRENFKGVSYYDPVTNLTIFGAVDDIWQKPDESLIIVDYKATSKTDEVTLDADWQDGYKRQMEVYQWLVRKNDFMVDNTGFFLYCNGITDRDVFDARLDFDITLLPYKGDDSWVYPTIQKLHECLNLSEVPEAGDDCDYCRYRDTVNNEIK